MSEVFVVKELFISSADGSGEANIIGLFKNKEDAINKLKERIKLWGPSFPTCDITISESLLDFYKEINPDPNSKTNSSLYTTNDLSTFCAISTECWYEYYLELTVEEKEIQ